MTAKLRLPRMLAHSVKSGLIHEVSGSTVQEVLEELFQAEPGLRAHLLDGTGSIRPHVSVFVDGSQASLDSRVSNTSDVRVLHAVSGGGEPVSR